MSADILPVTRAISALVRRIVFNLNGALAFNGHKTISLEEHSTMFNLGDASRILDGIAVLKGMDQHEERARRELLELFDVFNPGDLGAGPMLEMCKHGRGPTCAECELENEEHDRAMSEIHS